MMSAGAFLLMLGVILYFGVLASALFARYKIPDVINLILIGVLLGPVFHVIRPAFLTAWMPIVGGRGFGSHLI